MTSEASPTRVTEIEERHVSVRLNTATNFRACVERSLERRSARRGTRRAKVEDAFKRTGTRAWMGMKRRPAIGIVTAGATGMALASVIGVGELAIGFVSAFAAYQVLAEGIAPKEVAREAAAEFSRLTEG